MAIFAVFRSLKPQKLEAALAPRTVAGAALFLEAISAMVLAVTSASVNSRSADVSAASP